MRMIVTTCPFCNSENVEVIESVEKRNNRGQVFASAKMECLTCGSKGQSKELWEAPIEEPIEEIVEDSVQGLLGELSEALYGGEVAQPPVVSYSFDTLEEMLAHIAGLAVE